MHNELFSIGPFTVYGYGLMIAIGIFSAYCLAEYRARKIGLDDKESLALRFGLSSEASPAAEFFITLRFFRRLRRTRRFFTGI